MDLSSTFKLPLCLSGRFLALYLCQDAPLPSSCLRSWGVREGDGRGARGEQCGAGDSLLGGLRRWLCFTAGVRPALCTQPSVPGSADHSLFSFFRPEVGWMPLNCPRALPHPSWFLYTLPAPRPIAVLLNLLNDPVRASSCFLPGPCQKPSRAPEPRSAYCESDSHGG